TDLSVRDTANAGNWSIQSNLQAGNTAYGDRAHTFETIPSSLAGSTWIRTANSSKLFAGNPVVTFSLAAAADVLISLDNRAPLPSWVDETWTDTGMDLVIRENATTTRSFSIFMKRFAAGQVALGPWNSNAISMYSIVIKGGWCKLNSNRINYFEPAKPLECGDQAPLSQLYISQTAH